MIIFFLTSVVYRTVYLHLSIGTNLNWVTFHLTPQKPKKK